MFRKKYQQEQFVEIFLILICLALCCLLYRVGSHGMVVLNLFYLPVILTAFFLGRYSAGVLALLCALCAAMVTTFDLRNLVGDSSPLTIGLTLLIWSAVLGLTSILVGTLSDERMEKIKELHDAYVGVVEVLARYLNSADPKLNDRATRISKLSQQVAARMRLSDKEIDDIRVAALLQDFENIEVTTRAIRKAVDDLRHRKRRNTLEHTFKGSDLVQSLGSVLAGALPLLVDHNDCLNLDAADVSIPMPAEAAIGARIIHTVRSYVTLISQDPRITDPRDAMDALKNGMDGDHHPAVLHALKQVLFSASRMASPNDCAEPVTAGDDRC
jgi:hypothetical protein